MTHSSKGFFSATDSSISRKASLGALAEERGGREGEKPESDAVLEDVDVAFATLLDAVADVVGLGG